MNASLKSGKLFNMPAVAVIIESGDDVRRHRSVRQYAEVQEENNLFGRHSKGLPNARADRTEMNEVVKAGLRRRS